MSDADSIDLGWGAGAELKASGRPAALWQVNTRGRKVVEMTDAELLVSFRAGKVTGRSLVWSEGMAEWAPVEEVPRLTLLTRPDSEPPASGERAVSDEVHAGSKGYTSAGSEPPTDPGTLAIYERPLATIEFPQVIEAPESAEEPTPAFGSSPNAMATRALPKPATRDSVLPSKLHTVKADPPAPALPPLPKRGSSTFPAPVSSSPLAAALSSTVAPSPPPPPVAPVSAPTSAASAKIITPLSSLVPAVAPKSSPAAAPATAPLQPSLSFGARPSDERPPVISRPRPAIEFLPPIIVHEKEDDGASLLELPLDVPFHESTLVLSGRKRGRRWVPLNAAVAAALGAACLASALTALVVKSRPLPPPRIVEKRVLVPAAPAPIVEAPRAVPTSPVAQAPAVKATADTERPAVSERKSDASTTSAKARESWRRDDPGVLETAEPAAPRRELRAGFPTNPGF